MVWYGINIADMLVPEIKIIAPFALPPREDAVIIKRGPNIDDMYAFWNITKERAEGLDYTLKLKVPRLRTEMVTTPPRPYTPRGTHSGNPTMFKSGQEFLNPDGIISYVLERYDPTTKKWLISVWDRPNAKLLPSLNYTEEEISERIKKRVFVKESEFIWYEPSEKSGSGNPTSNPKKFQVLRDDKVLKEFDTYDQAYEWIMWEGFPASSVSHALKYEGFKIIEKSSNPTGSGNPRKLSREERLEKIFKPIPELDAEIRTIEAPESESDKWIVEVGIYESLGEQGGDIVTEFFDTKPSEEEIKNSIRETLKEEKRDITEKYALSGREEMQLEALKKLKLHSHGGNPEWKTQKEEVWDAHAIAPTGVPVKVKFIAWIFTHEKFSPKVYITLRQYSTDQFGGVSLLPSLEYKSEQWGSVEIAARKLAEFKEMTLREKIRLPVLKPAHSGNPTTPTEEYFEPAEYDMMLRWDVDVYEKPVVWLSTAHDPSVGIFGFQISPIFHTADEVKAWWEKHRKEVIEAIDRPKPDWEKLKEISWKKNPSHPALLGKMVISKPITWEGKQYVVTDTGTVYGWDGMLSVTPLYVYRDGRWRSYFQKDVWFDLPTIFTEAHTEAKLEAEKAIREYESLKHSSNPHDDERWTEIPEKPEGVEYQGVKGHPYWRSLTLYWRPKTGEYFAQTASGQWLKLKERSHSEELGGRLIDWIPHVEGSPGIEYKAPLEPVPCTCYEVDGTKMCFRHGIIGTLSQEQRKRLCSEEIIKTEGIARRVKAFKAAVEVCKVEIEKFPKGQRLEPYLRCMSVEAEKRGIKI